MAHEPFASLDEMLSLEAMSDLEHRIVMNVECEQWQPTTGAASGCPFLKVHSHGSTGARDYFVKRTSYATDVIRRLTGDYECRERLIWEHGLLDELQPDVECPTVACASDGDGWAVLMHDVSASLQRIERTGAGEWQVLSWANVNAIVDALASMHARFYSAPSLRDPALNLCTAYQMYAWSCPERLDSEATPTPRPVDILRNGWELLDQLGAPDVACALSELRLDPTPLEHALQRYAHTLVHGDLKRENLGLTEAPRPRLVLIDWQFAAALPPTVDLAWLLMYCQPIAVPKERVIDRYHQQLSRRLGHCFDERTWEPQLRLALLGQAVRLIGLMLWGAYYQTMDAVRRDLYAAELPWWTEQARLGLEYL